MAYFSLDNENSSVERKIISISSKRQITIPQKYFDALGFDNEAECVLKGDSIIIRPLRQSCSGEFDEQILADLIAKGFSGQNLLDKFKETRQKIRPAVKQIITETDDRIKNHEYKITKISDVFSAEDNSIKEY